MFVAKYHHMSQMDSFTLIKPPFEHNLTYCLIVLYLNLGVNVIIPGLF